MTDGGHDRPAEGRKSKWRVGSAGCGSVCVTPFLVEVKFIDGGIH